MRKLVLATKNLGKVAEFERLLSEHASGIKVLGLADFPNMPEVIESGKTLSQNALLKAKMISAFTNLPTLSDLTSFSWVNTLLMLSKSCSLASLP